MADSPYSAEERHAFGELGEAMLEPIRRTLARPVRNVLGDQIVWGRAPLRLDLGGGWTDTPPYCLRHGGRVTNVAVELNGQPPVQVFARMSSCPAITIHSIDLGVAETVTEYDQLRAYARPGSEFAVAKAALAQAGFLPEFHADGGFDSLVAQIRDLGGGIELSLLAAVPHGCGMGTSSILAAVPHGCGMGTSSILAAAALGSLSELCRLHWSAAEVVQRTLALEQMLTTGGGWQDQAGGMLRGIKLVETAPGPEQRLLVRWLPEHLFTQGCQDGL